MLPARILKIFNKIDWLGGQMQEWAKAGTYAGLLRGMRFTTEIHRGAQRKHCATDI